MSVWTGPPQRSTYCTRPSCASSASWPKFSVASIRKPEGVVSSTRPPSASIASPTARCAASPRSSTMIE
jgi:hypothetical protein